MSHQYISAHKITTYWGQNGVYASHPQREHWEKDLSEFCKNYNYDTIVLSFLHIFFDNGNKDNMPGFNFAFHCEKGVSDQYPSLLRCPKIELGIKECQKHGKTVLMSLGGASGAYGFRNDAQAKQFAYRVYHLLLEGTDLQDIRPFGTAILNGVDLDIEGGPPTGYTTFVKEIRRLEKTGKQKITIAAAPQCPYPDLIQGPSPGHFLGDVPELIDEIYIQFYNNYCHLGNPATFKGVLKQWLSYSESKNGPSIFIGVPAARAAAPGGGYVSPDVVESLYNEMKHESRLGGIMMWDASFDQNSMISGKRFSEHIGNFLQRGPIPTGKPVTLPPGKTTASHGRKTTKVRPTQPHYEDCEGLEDGLYPMRDCRKYIQCAGGRTYKHTCAEGLYFNPKINSCDWPEHVDCKMPKL
jgi:chitinase